jgi:hypothetical protein
MNPATRSRLRPCPALVVAAIALAVSLGGTGYAAFRLPASSVSTAQLKTGAVTSLKVKNRTLLTADFKPGQLRAGRPDLPGNKVLPAPKAQREIRGTKATQAHRV